MPTAEEVARAVEAAAAVRKTWIDARVSDFAQDSSERDRAIATLLYDSLMLREAITEMSATVREKGIGGLMKALMNGR